MNNANLELEKKCKELITFFGENGIALRFYDKEKKLLLDRYVIYYSSKLSAIQTLEEVFVDMAYHFYTDSASPFIIDAGSEVGMATIFFKIFYPTSRILSFEAHPYSFELLQKNIKVNELDNVTAINKALTNKEGVVDFFGEFDCVDGGIDTRGSSIIEAWGLQRATSCARKVNATRLSQYIEHNVDYLKMNIEGAEQQVLEDLEAENKMGFIDRILVKFHHSLKTKDINDLDYGLWMLSKNQFVIKKRKKKVTEQIFPNVTKGWALDNEVCLYTLYAEKIKNEKEESRNISNELQKKLYLLRNSLLEKESFLLRTIIDNVPSSIYWKDKEGFYLGHSAYAIQQLHNTKIAPDATIKNIVGKSDYDIFDKDIADRYRRNDLYVMESKKPIILEENIITPEGKKLIQISSKKPLYDHKMEVVGIIGSTIDITDRKKVDQLQQEKEVTEQVSKTVEILAGCIAHELRTPLCAIDINVDKLQKENKAEYIGNIKTAVKRSANIIDMLLIKLRSLVTKKVHVDKFEPHSIKACVNEALKEYPFYESELENVVWDDKSNEDFVYNGDDLFTKHVLFNLIKNALKATKEAERGKIYINLQPGQEFNYLIFKDTSTGIPAEVLQSLFQAFNSDSKIGTGLGLAFCKMTMHSYGGDITCKYEEGKYTEFTLSFPKSNKRKTS